MKQSMWREFILYLWGGWEKLFSALAHIKLIEPDSLFRLSIRQYRGPLMELKDGTQIRPGDQIGELHLNNKRLFQLQQDCSNRIRAVMSVKKELKQDLTRLGCLIAGKQIASEVRAFYGITIFHQVAQLLGFEVQEFKPTLLRVCYWLGQLLLLVLYHPSGTRRLSKGHRALSAKEIWISRSALLRDFSPKQN